MMDKKEVLNKLRSLGNEKTFKQNIKQGAGQNQFGVKLGDIRKVAKEIKIHHKLAVDLWNTGNSDARFVAILIMNPKQLRREELEQMLASIHFVRVADWFNSYIINKHPEREQFREDWMKSDIAMLARSGWHLTAEKIQKNTEGLDLTDLLKRIQEEAATAPDVVQWTMNFALAYIGIHSEEHRQEALKIGEALGMYRDYPTAKGCTSPYAPIWITEMVSRNT